MFQFSFVIISIHIMIPYAVLYINKTFHETIL